LFHSVPLENVAIGLEIGHDRFMPLSSQFITRRLWTIRRYTTFYRTRLHLTEIRQRRTGRRWEDNIRMDLNGSREEVVSWI